MKTEIRNAFEAVRRGYSADRVIADPELNAAFLAECRLRGLDQATSALNQDLLNLRKGRGLRGSPRALATSFPDEDNYRFASEIAARFLERRDGINVDNILCDPIKAQEFDALAVRISPGYSPLQYRWAALNLRKLRRLRPEIIGKALPSKRVTVVSVREIDAAELPLGQGLYIFFTSSEALYVGEAKNLRNRVEKHLDHSDRKELARWMWEYGNERTMLEIHVLDEATTTQVRRALEAELIRSRRPLFNIQNG